MNDSIIVEIPANVTDVEGWDALDPSDATQT